MTIVLVCPLILRCVFMGTFMLHGLLNVSRFKSNWIFIKFLKPRMQSILKCSDWFNESVSMMEIWVGIYLFLGIFFLKGAIVGSLLYWQILGKKYQLNSSTKRAFGRVNGRMQTTLAKIPIPAVLNAYRMVIGYLYGMVDAQRMQERARANQSQRGGTGGVTGMAKQIFNNCAIM